MRGPPVRKGTTRTSGVGVRMKTLREERALKVIIHQEQQKIFSDKF